jgi:hypothetical protein
MGNSKKEAGMASLGISFLLNVAACQCEEGILALPEQVGFGSDKRVPTRSASYRISSCDF